MIFGLEALELPEGYTPLEAVALIKCLDEDGVTVIVQRITRTWASWDVLGPVVMLVDSIKNDLSQGWVNDEPEEEDNGS